MADFYLDHVLIAVRDLEQAAETFSDRLGLTLTPEGVHPCRGTHNRLVVFGPEYLELIAVREPAEPVFRPSMASFLESREGLYMFTLGTNDLDTAVSDLRGRGFQVGEPEPGSRQREDGTIAYTWSSTGVDPTATPGSEVFLIQHAPDRRRPLHRAFGAVQACKRRHWSPPHGLGGARRGGCRVPLAAGLRPVAQPSD